MTKYDIFTIIFFPLLLAKNVFSFVTTQHRIYFFLAIVWLIISVWNLCRINKMYPLEEDE